MIRSKPLIAAPLLALLLGACNQQAVETAAETATTMTAPLDADCPTDGEPMAEAKLYVEHNATDEDTGVHGSFGGEAWTELCIWDPSGRLILLIDPVNQFEDLGVADLFFESREPGNDELPIDVLLAAFPEGAYRAGGTDFEGTPRVGTASFTHAIPAPPTITAPELSADEEDPAGAPIDGSQVIVAWEPVVDTIGGEPVTIAGYQVIVTKLDHEDPHGWSQPVYDVHVGPETTELEVAPEFLESGAGYELEVLALEASGNQTIALGFFAVD